MDYNRVTQSSRFPYIKEKLPKISGATIKEKIFVGPHIDELIKDENFYQQLNQVQNYARTSFKNVPKGIAQNYKILIKELLMPYKAQGCIMSLKIHF